MNSRIRPVGIGLKFGFHTGPHITYGSEHSTGTFLNCPHFWEQAFRLTHLLDRCIKPFPYLTLLMGGGNTQPLPQRSLGLRRLPNKAHEGLVRTVEAC